MKLSFLLINVLFSFYAIANNCEEVRGAFDIGSGSTKAYVAVVDTCKKTILKTLHEEQASIGFKDSLEKSKDQTFSNEVISEAKLKIQSMTDKMKKLNAKRISAVATAAFRDAKNAQKAANEIAGKSGVKIKIISQKEEARLGVRSAMANPSLKQDSENKLAIWDIGGGSMQITYSDKKGYASVYEGDLASVNFKNKVISELQKKDIKQVSSPNPIGADFTRAIALAENDAKKNTPDSLKKVSSTSKWIGIGGVWWFSVRNQLNKSKLVTDKDLEKALNERSKLKDDQIKSSYAATDVTNLALVLGYMKALSIKQVEPIEASLVQGLVLE